MSEKPEMITMYRGQLLTEMSKDALIEAIVYLYGWNLTLAQGAQADREMFTRIMKSRVTP